MEKREFMLSGLSLIGDQTGRRKGAAFRAVNPTSAAELEPVFYSATSEDMIGPPPSRKPRSRLLLASADASAQRAVSRPSTMLGGSPG